MRKTIATVALSILFGTVVLVSGCKSNSSDPYSSSSTGPAPTPTPASPNTVIMSGMAFSPATITVTAGSSVTWKNNDSYAHTATSDAGTWDTGNVSASGASITFNTPGTFAYHCTYHAAMGMKGTVIVK